MKTKIKNTDLSVSPICMGTAHIGSLIGQEDSFRLLDMFYNDGGNFLTRQSPMRIGFWAGKECK